MKQLIGHDIGTYVFDKVAKTIKFSGVTITQDQILSITNTTHGIVLYLFNKSTLSGSFSVDTLTLDYDTSSMANTDKLQIFIDIPNVIEIIKPVDELDVAYGIKQIDGKPRVSSMPYVYDIAEGNVLNHYPLTKIGYLPSFTQNVNTDVWSYGGVQPVYLFPDVAMGMEFLSSDNTDDIGTVIKSGTSTGGTITSLIDSGVDFTTATAVAVGDCVVLDKSGTTPEFGYVTAIAQHELTIAGGFSSGGSGLSRAYEIIDSSAHDGGHAVEISGLNGNYEEQKEIGILNGTTVIPTVKLTWFRINSFRIIAAGVNKLPTGNLTIRHINNTPVYSYITTKFTRARNAMYTVPLGKNLYVTDVSGGYAIAGSPNKEYCRITTKANIDPTTKFKTDGIFYPFTDLFAQNISVSIMFTMPTKLPQKTDIKISAIGSASGSVISTLRGWLESN